MRRTRVLRQLIADDMYVVDERLVAESIMSRAQTRSFVPGIFFGNEYNAPAVRSFRLEHEARSFRLGAHARTRR
ncbi:MAG TPA: hypothetical protein VG295_14845 [Solirubrobacteraceae bacterium]|jgi:hypothetical protein|nr:hypothetical protein [Solirubrobacteraceae bacterium]